MADTPKQIAALTTVTAASGQKIPVQAATDQTVNNIDVNDLLINFTDGNVPAIYAVADKTTLDAIDVTATPNGCMCVTLDTKEIYILDTSGQSPEWKAYATNLYEKMLYVNIGINDINDVISSINTNTTIKLTGGSFSGDTPDNDINLQDISNVLIEGQYKNTLLSGTRKVLINGANATRVRLKDVSIYGEMIIDGTEGRHSFEQCDFIGDVTIQNNATTPVVNQNWIIFNNCEFGADFSINADFTGVIMCNLCDFEGASITNDATAAQVIFTGCTGISNSFDLTTVTPAVFNVLSDGAGGVTANAYLTDVFGLQNAPQGLNDKLAEIVDVEAGEGLKDTDGTFSVSVDDSTIELNGSKEVAVKDGSIDVSKLSPLPPKNMIGNKDGQNNGISVLTRSEAREVIQAPRSVGRNGVPTASDDVFSEYRIGDYWYDLDTNYIYTCLRNDANNAYWERISYFIVKNDLSELEAIEPQFLTDGQMGLTLSDGVTYVFAGGAWQPYYDPSGSGGGSDFSYGTITLEMGGCVPTQSVEIYYRKGMGFVDFIFPNVTFAPCTSNGNITSNGVFNGELMPSTIPNSPTSPFNDTPIVRDGICTLSQGSQKINIECTIEEDPSDPNAGRLTINPTGSFSTNDEVTIFPFTYKYFTGLPNG